MRSSNERLRNTENNAFIFFQKRLIILDEL